MTMMDPPLTKEQIEKLPQSTKDDELFRAIECHDLKRMDTALEAGAQINSRNPCDTAFTVLHHAIKHSAPDAIFKKLLEKGANINDMGGLGCTPLSYALSREDIAAAELILAHNPDVNLDTKSNPPLNLAVCGNHAAIVEQLLKKGANPNAITGNLSETPFFAFKSKAVAKLLLDYGADINARDSHKNTPLITAASKNDARKCGILIELGADINLRTQMGDSALDMAAFSNDYSTSTLLLRAGAELRAATYEKIPQLKNWLDTIKSQIENVFPPGTIPTHETCLSGGIIREVVLNACGTGQFTTLIAAPLLASKNQEDRQLFKDIWDQLPQYWQNRYGSLHAQFVKAGCVQPAMGHHTSAIANTTDSVRSIPCP